MTKKRILCSISTKGRYHTFLPLAIQAVINQTRKPDLFVIYDDNDPPEDMRNFPVYQQLFKMMDLKDIKWEWLFAEKKGQHFNHQKANERAKKEGYDYVWRVDDDNSPEPNVLANLEKEIQSSKVGAVGGAILTPNWDTKPRTATGKIVNIDNEPNIQWGHITKRKEVEHLHCSFLYKAGVFDYNLGLSRVAHREETLFTYGLFKLGYKIVVIPDTVTWHFKSDHGGIRSDNILELYNHDEKIFRNLVEIEDTTIVVLDCGMGDHIVFKHVLPLIKNPQIYSCYPAIIPGRSIQEAKERYGDIDRWNIYKKMDEWKWRKSLEQAFKKMYGVDQ
jgi:hypothetical protein